MCFDSLDIDFHESESKGHYQGTSYQTDHPKSLNSSEHREEKKKGMDLCSGADQEGSEKIVDHTDQQDP